MTPSLLSFLSVLECGINYGSEIARTLGVSRQMVAKTVKELCQLGYLEQVDDIGKQKKILFTQSGEQLIADARQLLADLDSLLLQKLKTDTLLATSHNLKTINQLISNQVILQNTKE